MGMMKTDMWTGGGLEVITGYEIEKLSGGARVARDAIWSKSCHCAMSGRPDDRGACAIGLDRREKQQQIK